MYAIADSTNPPQNVSATTSNSQMVTVTWNYDNVNVRFRISCGIDETTLSTVVNNTTEATLHGVKLLLLPSDTQYECCVSAIGLSDYESERVCDNIFKGLL